MPAQVQHNADVLGTRPRFRMRSRDGDEGEDDDAALWDIMILDEARTADPSSIISIVLNCTQNSLRENMNLWDVIFLDELCASGRDFLRNWGAIAKSFDE